MYLQRQCEIAARGGRDRGRGTGVRILRQSRGERRCVLYKSV